MKLINYNEFMKKYLNKLLMNKNLLFWVALCFFSCTPKSKPVEQPSESERILT